MPLILHPRDGTPNHETPSSDRVLHGRLVGDCVDDGWGAEDQQSVPPSLCARQI
jgi:hypothetical protein